MLTYLPFIKGLRAAPVSNFVSWPSEIVRGSTNMTVKAIAETKDPVMARVGYERANGYGCSVGYGSTFSWCMVFNKHMVLQMKNLCALKEFVPYFSADSTILPVYILMVNINT